MTSPLEYVEMLAAALDRDDYETAALTMAEDVEYTIGGKHLVGPEAIVESYRASSQRARRMFDGVEYAHDVKPTEDPNRFRVGYQDILSIGTETLTHMAEQHVTAAADVGVTHIVNVDLDGEREKVEGFLARHGLSMDG